MDVENIKEILFVFMRDNGDGAKEIFCRLSGEKTIRFAWAFNEFETVAQLHLLNSYGKLTHSNCYIYHYPLARDFADISLVTLAKNIALTGAVFIGEAEFNLLVEVLKQINNKELRLEDV